MNKKIKNIFRTVYSAVMRMKTYNIGDKVYIDGYTSFCSPSHETVKNVEYRFDAFTGKPYQLVTTGTGSFRSDTGECVKGPTMYYMETK